MKYTDYNQSHQSNQSSTDQGYVSVFTSPLGKIHHADQGCLISYYKSGIFQSDDGDKQAYSRGNRHLYRIRYRPDNRFSQPYRCNNNKENTGNKYNNKGFIISIAHSQYNRVCKKCIQSHSGCLGKRNLRIQHTKNRSDKSTDTCSDKYTIWDFLCHCCVAHDHIWVCKNLRI